MRAGAFSLGSFSDPGINDGPWAVTVDWGDGSARTTFRTCSQGCLGSPAHTYADNGSYTVTVLVSDQDGCRLYVRRDRHSVAPEVPGNRARGDRP